MNVPFSLEDEKILFCGDPHGNFRQIIEQVNLVHPDAVILLGDMDCSKPLDQELSPVLDKGIPVYWIIGNHDTDKEEYYDNLMSSSISDFNLNGKILDICGLKIAGLGGVFRGKIWNPNSTEIPSYQTREQFLKNTPAPSRWKGGIPRKHRSTIFPEDFSNLLKMGEADILVSHEAPSSHSFGFLAIDELANDLKSSVIIHGHHHERYAANLDSGISVVGLEQEGLHLLFTHELKNSLSFKF